MTRPRSLVHPGRCIGLLSACLALLLTPGSSAAAVASNVDAPLTDGRTYSHWAHPARQDSILKLPDPAAAQVARTHYYTEGGSPEVYAVLASTRDTDGGRWYEVGVPMRPNASTGWVREATLGPLYRSVTRLIVDRRRMRAQLLRRGKVVWSSPVGVGAARTPTPAGHFWIREKFRIAASGGLYGPVAFGTSAYSRLTDWPGGGVIGVHGTNEPNLIPGHPSHGCVRVPNAAIKQLYRLMPVGTTVDVR